jgi:hypothetical protein
MTERISQIACVIDHLIQGFCESLAIVYKQSFFSQSMSLLAGEIMDVFLTAC